MVSSTRCRNTPEGLPGGRQPTPTVARKAPPGLTPTLPDYHIPIILPILRGDMPRAASTLVSTASAGTTHSPECVGRPRDARPVRARDKVTGPATLKSILRSTSSRFVFRVSCFVMLIACAVNRLNETIPTRSSIGDGDPCVYGFSGWSGVTIPSAIPKNPFGSFQLWTDRNRESTRTFVQTSRTQGIRMPTSSGIPSSIPSGTFQRDPGKA
ncbi:hypothetical protein OKW28_002113 [Paraburkholderia sp. 40]